MSVLELNNDYRDMLVELARAHAEHVIVGAYALAAHGHARATKDIDIFVRPSVENAARVHSALVRFGAPLDSVTADDLATPGVVLQIGVEPRRIDLTTAIDGISFEEAVASAITVQIGDISVAVIGRDALLKNKRAAGRPQDLADVAALEGRSETKAGLRDGPQRRKGPQKPKKGPPRRGR